MNEAIVSGNANGFNYGTVPAYFVRAAIFNFANGFISLGFGLASGLFLGWIFICFNYYEGDAYFTDSTFWESNYDLMKFYEGDGHKAVND